MSINATALKIIERLRSYNHDLSNYLLTASLTLELFGSVRNMTPEDFEQLRIELTKVLTELQKSSEDLRHLNKLVAGEINQIQILPLKEGEVA